MRPIYVTLRALEHCDSPKVTNAIPMHESGYELQYTYMHMLTHLVQFKSNAVWIRKSLDKGGTAWIYIHALKYCKILTLLYKFLLNIFLIHAADRRI